MGTRRLQIADVWRGVATGLIVGTAATILILSLAPSGAGAAEPGSPGGAGIAGPLGDTSSAVTLSGRGYFSNLRIHVNQTQHLTNQSVSVSWSGCTAAAPYTSGCGPTFSNVGSWTFGSTFAGNYLQIFECWGSPDSEVPSNPGPSPTNCEFGGESNTPTSSYPVISAGFQYSRTLSQPSWPNYTSSPGWVDPSSGFKVEPFNAVDGTVVNRQFNPGWDSPPFPGFWDNSYYSFDTTNELDFNRTFEDGTGSARFQVDTGLEGPGLGCGQAVQPSGHGPVIPQCWLVIVPRSTPALENPAGIPEDLGVLTSPLSPQAWANRIAIPLGFNPVGSSCAIGANEQRIAGSELATPAVSSWQPALCASPGNPPFNYASLSDVQARQELATGGYGAPGMVVSSGPISGASNPVSYAPLTLSGAVIAFSVERVPAVVNGNPAPGEVPLTGDSVANLYLTPRLVAKLLTESYSGQFAGLNPNNPPSGYSWIAKNPYSLVSDPDFLQYNAEFAQLQAEDKIDASSLVVESASSDAAALLWQWVLSDHAAREWLEGVPDAWGMEVNPVYSLNPDQNPGGTNWAVPAPISYPKSDPYCTENGATPIGQPPQLPRALCMLDFEPYVLNMQSAAQAVVTANDGAKTTFNANSYSASTAWSSNGPQRPGTYFIMAVTDSASAARYGLQTASLSRDGDDGSAPVFVAPKPSSLLAGGAAMKPSGTAGVLVTNPAATAPNAYPLTMVTYAELQPAALTATQRKAYATFIRYAAGPGQQPGELPGQLVAGYAPLPAAWRNQALTTANEVANYVPLSHQQPGSGSTPTTVVTPHAPATPATPAPPAAPAPVPTPTTAAPTTTAVQPRPASVGSPTKGPPAALIRTPVKPAGFVRWALPIGAGIGAASGVASPFVGRRRIRRNDRPGSPFRLW